MMYRLTTVCRTRKRSSLLSLSSGHVSLTVRQILATCVAFCLLSLLPTIARANIDLNSDGNYDFLFQNQTSGNLVGWLMSSSTYLSGNTLPSPSSADWKLIDTAYITTDGKPDLLFQSQTTGQIAVWSMNGTAIATSTTLASTPGTGYQLVGTADFNSDGQTDLVFQNSSTGQMSFWFMNNISYVSGTTLTTLAPTGYKVVGVSDFNGDGKPDLVFQNSSTGAILFWLMNGTSIVSTPALSATPATGFQVVGISDFNGDGQRDLLFQNLSTGQLVYWLLNGTTFNGGSTLASTVSSGWQVTGMRSFHSSLAISNVNNGDTLSADWLVNVSATNNYQYADVKLQVDGTVVAWGSTTLTPTGSNLEQLAFDTYGFSNGSHTLTVLDQYGNTDIRTVTFSNQVGNISVDPIFDLTPGVTDVPSTCSISATLTSSVAWTVTVQTTEEIPVTVRTYSGTSSSINVSWDGKDGTGVEVADDVYDIVFTSPAQTTKKKVNKNKVGDCFLIFETDRSVFPTPSGAGSFAAYKNFILRAIKPKVGIDFNAISIIGIDGADMAKNISTGTIAARINKHFSSTRLNLFYVDSHGQDGPNPFFGIGPYTWYSSNPGTSGHGPIANFDLSSVVSPIGYGNGVVDSPGLVWIDSCDSAGKTGGNTSFLATFGSASTGYGTFVGWAGSATNYGVLLSSASDCWSKWREQFWTQMFVAGNNIQTSFNKANSLTTNFGSTPAGYRPNDLAQWFGVGATGF